MCPVMLTSNVAFLHFLQYGGSFQVRGTDDDERSRYINMKLHDIAVSIKRNVHISLLIIIMLPSRRLRNMLDDFYTPNKIWGNINLYWRAQRKMQTRVCMDYIVNFGAGTVLFSWYKTDNILASLMFFARSSCMYICVCVCV